MASNVGIESVNKQYKTTYDTGTNLFIQSTVNMIVLKPADIGGYYDFFNTSNKITIEFPDGTSKEVANKVSDSGEIELKQSGTYTLRYSGEIRQHFYVGGRSTLHDYSFYYTFSTVENKLPLKPWTIASVINRLLDVCEPLRQGEKPRFRLNGMRADGTIITPDNKQDGEEVGQAYKFDKIFAPQFSLTRQTLRECLQEIGKVIHGEPRLRKKKGQWDEYTLFSTEDFTNGEVLLGTDSYTPYDINTTYYVMFEGKYLPTRVIYGADPSSPADDAYFLSISDSNYTGKAAVYSIESVEKYYYEVYYDLFTQQQETGLWTVPYVSKGLEWVINNYQTWVDSNAEHLINQLDKLGGVIIEPYDKGSKSVRTENQYVRVYEQDMIIATQYPIYTVEKLEYVYLNGDNVEAVDITEYVFERSEYDTRLSSYSEQYPYSKAYGLYFAQGEKNIGGLNFKVESASSLIFKEYAITNILRQKLNNKDLTLNYSEMQFRITYTPVYDVRVAQAKPNYKDFKYPAALIVNQQSNIVESRYYGEYLKGVASRLGNVEMSLMYPFKSLKKVPSPGQLYRKDYYISAVAVECLPNYFRCTVGLSKDFNRLSAYIGVPSEKRYYEISEKQAAERNVLYREYVVVGAQEAPDADTRITDKMLSCIAATFTQTGDFTPLTSVVAYGSTYKGNRLNTVNLPVISSAFGNSVSFSWKYEDNYSAGAIVSERAGTIENGITGYWQNDARYTDFYGKMYYYSFAIQSAGTVPTASDFKEIGLALPLRNDMADYSDIYIDATVSPYILRKDNREAPQFNFQIDFVTNSDIIIGSALASNCPAVRGVDIRLAAKLYVLPTELNKFTDHLEGWEDVDLESMPSADVTVSVGNGYFTVNAGTFPADGKSWAIVTQQFELPAEQVEDEEGGVDSYEQTIGGDLLIGQNMEVTAGQAFTPIYFTKKRNIYDYSVWKDIR